MSSRVSRSIPWIAVGAVLLAIVLAVVYRPRAMGEAPQANAGATTAHAPHQLWHCGMHPQVVQDHPGDCPICHMALTPFTPGESGPSDAAGAPVTIDPAVVQNMGVRTALVTRGPLKRSIRAVGLLKLPEPGMHDVSLKVGGWVDKLYADQEGMHVHQGDVLFELYSPELQVASQELIAAVKAEHSLDAAAGAEVREEARRMVESARRKLRLWDVAEADIDAIAAASEPPRDVPFRSPATGHVEEKMIVQGSAVQPGMKLLRVADHRRMWLDAEVYAQDIPLVSLGQALTATVEGAPGTTFRGKVDFVYPHLDHMTRTLTVRATLDNPRFALKPGMYAMVEIATKPKDDAILCPREAVIDTGTRKLVFVAQGNGHFAPRPVKTGLEGDDDTVEITEGLAPGETVVTSGQFLIDVESRTIEATRKLSATAPSSPGARP
jgi:membrane fusion protein, copper/silver efflux system